MNSLQLNHFARLWHRRVLARESLLALGAACALAALSLALAPGRPALAVLAAGVGFGAALAGRLGFARPRRMNAAELGRHLDRTYPELEESSALWLRAPDGLTTLERLQRRRLDEAFARLEQGAGPAAGPVAGPPRGFLRSALVWAGLGAAALTAAGGWAAARRAGPAASAPMNPTLTPSVQPGAPAAAASKPGWPRVTDAELVIAPPAYTGRPERRVAALDAAEIEEGATVSWRLGLDHAPGGGGLRLVFGEGAAAGGEELPLAPGTDGRFTGQRVLTDSALYHLSDSLLDDTAWSTSEVHSLKVRKDAPPTLAITEPAAPRTVVEPTLVREASAAPPMVRVEVLAGDDFGVADARLIATVAKGSGEAVKFREQALAFDVNEPTAGLLPHGRRLVKTLDLAALGLEPGDELYFHVEAQDNREPTPNRARSETRFVTLKGPDAVAASPGRGVAGVNLVPQYFRSQRQIILDTEKLLADQPALADAEFRRRANDFGHDQALLRLRYGQFLGEEREEGAGDHPELNLNPLQPGVPAGVPADLVHQHDRADAGGAAPGDPRAGLRTAMRLRLEHERQARVGGGHDDAAAGPATGLPPAPGQIIAPFVDHHDSQEKATFFDGEVKGTLREALGAMWEAEKFLRVARPRNALAPENRALEILKALQQSARSYVQRVGFEPPPLKIAERRGRGDVSEVRPKELAPGLPPVNEGALGAVREALRAGPAGTEALRSAEPALTAAATRQPEEFLEALGVLRRLGAGETGSKNAWPVLERALWKLLPPGEMRPRRGREAAPSLAEPYFRALETGEAGGR